MASIESTSSISFVDFMQVGSRAGISGEKTASMG
jgi:hypothetical protein